MADDALRAVRAWTKKANAGRAGQHDAIRAAIEAGYSLRQVAEAAGLSHVGVAKIVKRANG